MSTARFGNAKMNINTIVWPQQHECTRSSDEQKENQQRRTACAGYGAANEFIENKEKRKKHQVHSV